MKRSFSIKSFASFTVLAVAALALFAACGADVPGDDGGNGGGTTATHGIFEGQITIGPACPVEPCDIPEGAEFWGHDLKFIRSGGVFSVPLNVDGTFRVELVPADYLIGMDGCTYAGCEVFPLDQTIAAGETVTFNMDFDTGVRSPAANAGYGAILADLINASGSGVGIGDVVEQPFFEPQGKTLIVNGESIQIFSFESVELADAAAALVAPNGGSVGTSMVMWMASPHFFRYDLGAPDSVIAIYVGDDPTVLGLLHQVAGPQFAGADNGGSMGIVEGSTGVISPTDADPQASMEKYLALMIDLRNTLANVSNPDAGGDAIADAIDIGNEIAKFTVVFRSMSPRVMASLVEVYAEPMQTVNAEVAALAASLATIKGTEELVAVLQLGPAYALTSSSSLPRAQSDDIVEILEPVESPQLILPGEETGDVAPIMEGELTQR
jgi:hypothetical protein